MQPYLRVLLHPPVVLYPPHGGLCRSCLGGFFWVERELDPPLPAFSGMVVPFHAPFTFLLLSVWWQPRRFARYLIPTRYLFSRYTLHVRGVIFGSF